MPSNRSRVQEYKFCSLLQWCLKADFFGPNRAGRIWSDDLAKLWWLHLVNPSEWHRIRVCHQDSLLRKCSGIHFLWDRISDEDWEYSQSVAESWLWCLAVDLVCSRSNRVSLDRGISKFNNYNRSGWERNQFILHSDWRCNLDWPNFHPDSQCCDSRQWDSYRVAYTQCRTHRKVTRRRTIRRRWRRRWRWRRGIACSFVWYVKICGRVIEVQHRGWKLVHGAATGNQPRYLESWSELGLNEFQHFQLWRGKSGRSLESRQEKERHEGNHLS